MFSRRARELVIVVALLLLAGLLLRANTRSPQELNWLDRLVLRLTAPVESVAERGASSLGESWRRYVQLVGTERDNRRLQAENAQLRGELGRAEATARRSVELEQLLGLRAVVPSETLAARVIGVETSPLFRVLRVKLDRGEGEVRPGLPVVVPAGIVGSVRRVYGPYCDVLLAIDPESSIDVLSMRTGAQGTLRGVAGEYRFRARHLRTDDVRPGDQLVTSGHDGLFPRDLAVGTVLRVGQPAAGLWRDADVAPAVDFARLDAVLIVLAPAPPPDPDAGRRASPPHHGLGAPR